MNTERRLDVALVSGDGIGPELAEATQEVLDATGLPINWIAAPIGKKAMEQGGEPVPAASLEAIRRCGVAIKAPLIAEKISGGITVGGRHYPSINNAIRQELGAYANVRPTRGYKAISGRYADMDIVIVREVSEGIYSGIEREVDADTGHTVNKTTRSASLRIGEFAFRYARRHHRKRVTAVHKANVLHKTDGLFLQVMKSVAEAYPDVQFDDQMIDAACYHQIKTPGFFDVLVMPNQYGDIFSDVAAGLAGSMGLAPGANFGDDVAFFEASHGAAPDIAGKGIANPVSLILSGAMMLDYLGYEPEAERVRKAVERALEVPGARTPDIGGSATTGAMTKHICQYLNQVYA